MNGAAESGWRAVWTAFVVAVFGWGVGFYDPAVYLVTLHRERGWSISTLSAAITAHFLVSALLITRLPMLYRRLGLARVTIEGTVLAAAGVLAWAEARQPWQLVPALVLSAAGWSTMSGAALNAVVRPRATQGDQHCLQRRQRRRPDLCADLGVGDRQRGDACGRGGDHWRHDPGSLPVGLVLP